MTAVLIRTKEGNSLVIQWLRFHASIAGGMGLIPGWRTNLITWVFPDSSVGKESACNAGDPDWIPGSGRSPGEGNGNPLLYSCLESPMVRGAWRATVHGVTQSGHD